jgi:hypothetical protein
MLRAVAVGACYRAPETEVVLMDPPKGHFMCSECSVRFAVLYVRHMRVFLEIACMGVCALTMSGCCVLTVLQTVQALRRRHVRRVFLHVTPEGHSCIAPRGSDPYRTSSVLSVLRCLRRAV